MTFLFLPLQGLGMFIQVLMMWLLIFLLQNKEEGSSQKKKGKKEEGVCWILWRDGVKWA